MIWNTTNMQKNCWVVILKTAREFTNKCMSMILKDTNMNHLQCTIKDSMKSWIMRWYHNADDRIEIEKFAWKDAGNLIAAISYLRKLNIRTHSVKALTCLYFRPFLYFLEIFLVWAHTIINVSMHTHTLAINTINLT